MQCKNKREVSGLCEPQARLLSYVYRSKSNPLCQKAQNDNVLPLLFSFLFVLSCHLFALRFIKFTNLSNVCRTRFACLAKFMVSFVFLPRLLLTSADSSFSPST